MYQMYIYKINKIWLITKKYNVLSKKPVAHHSKSMMDSVLLIRGGGDDVSCGEFSEVWTLVIENFYNTGFDVCSVKVNQRKTLRLQARLIVAMLRTGWSYNN